MNKKKVLLHVGCGQKNINQTPFNKDNWKEIRLDIDKGNNPDILNSITNMIDIKTGSIDAVYSSHNIEHLYTHEVRIALKEFNRVLKKEGFALITCPDLLSTCKLIAEDKLTESAYISPIGPITPLDILYGHRECISKGNQFMAHKTGFTKKTISDSLIKAGFIKVATKARSIYFDLWAIGKKENISKEKLLQLAKDYFP